MKKRTGTRKTRKKPKSDKKKLELQLWELCKQYVRLRDNETCQKCHKKILNPKGMDTSHVLCKNRYKSLKFDDRNLKLMCMYCHKWFHNNPVESGEWFKITFPHRWAYLSKMKLLIKKTTIEDLQEMIEEYTDKIIGLEMKE